MFQIFVGPVYAHEPNNVETECGVVQSLQVLWGEAGACRCLDLSS